MEKRRPIKFMDGDTVVADIGDRLEALFRVPGDTIIGTLVDVAPGFANAVGISEFDRGDTLSTVISLASWFAIVFVSKRVRCVSRSAELTVPAHSSEESRRLRDVKTPVLFFKQIVF